MDRNQACTRPTAVDLFAGAGGLSLGLEQAGFDVLAAVEYDPVHAATHAFNFPLTEVVARSVAGLSGTDVLAAAEAGWRRHRPGADWDREVDLIAGGPPCQGFSWIGKRRVDDERNDLIFHFWRLVHEIRPKYFVMENVPGMLSGAHRELLDDLLRRFDEDGYKVQPPSILSASHHGVPQARRRLVLIGSRDDQSVATYPVSTTKPPQRGDHSPGLLPFSPTVRDAIGDLPDLDRYASLIDNDSVTLRTSVVDAMEEAASAYARRLRGLANDTADYSYRREWNPLRLTSSMRTLHSSASVQRFRATRPGEVEPVSRFLRLDPDGLCNTLRAGTASERGAFTSPRPIHPFKPRVISVREAARLHSFPDWFRLHVTKWHGFRQVGNAVPPLLGRAVGSAVLDALGITPEKPDLLVALGESSLVSLNMREAAEVFGVAMENLPRQRDRGVSRHLEPVGRDE